MRYKDTFNDRPSSGLVLYQYQLVILSSLQYKGLFCFVSKYHMEVHCIINKTDFVLKITRKNRGTWQKLRYLTLLKAIEVCHHQTRDFMTFDTQK